MKQLKYFLIFLALLIVVVIVANYINSKPRKAKQNSYEYNVDEYKKVDPELISHKEVRQIKINIGEYGGIATSNNLIYLAADSSVKILTVQGQLQSQFSIEDNPRCIGVNNERLIVGYKDHFTVYTHSGDELFSTGKLTDSTLITSVAFWEENIVVADAGKRRVYIYTQDQKVAEIEGVSGSNNLLGFIVPSPYFDLAVNTENELWCTNPGMHALQQYNLRGDLLENWDKASNDIDGFTGCCNPAQFSFLPDGRFVTSEKGMPRIKIYTPSGKLESVVAAPSKFEGNQHAAEVATIGETIVALDFDRKMIRIFEHE
ncbi:MAG: hypothetical protein K9H26_01655 [Prolixibacteraceae bacterium]|nr:hypothetical protein [Prolixibacteraceae bacterium]